MRSFTKVLLIVLLMVVPFESAQGKYQGVVTPFEAIDVPCEAIEGGGDVNFKGRIVSDEILVAGVSILELSFAENGKVLAHVTLRPDAFDGEWVAPGQGQDTPAGLSVKHVGRGTGALAGRKIILKTQGVVELHNPPCDPVGPVVRLIGQIIEPPGTIK